MTLREQLLGTWTLVSNVNSRDGIESYPFGPQPLGQLMLNADGNCSVLMFERDLPAFVSGRRIAGTEEENRRVVHGSLAVFGNFDVLESECTLVLRAIASTYPNLNGIPMRRPLSLGGDLQTWQVKEATVGGTSQITWKRTSS